MENVKNAGFRRIVLWAVALPINSRHTLNTSAFSLKHT